MNESTTMLGDIKDESCEVIIHEGLPNIAKDISTEEAEATKKKTISFITLEVHYARKDVKSAKPYLREPVSINFDSSGKFTFRSFLRHGIYQKRPELKYGDNDVVFFQTPKGTNLLSIMDEPINTLPDLLASREQKLLKVIILGRKSQKFKVDPQLKYIDPNINAPAWPKTRLEGNIPEDSSIHDWISRPFIIDAWQNPKKRFRLIVISSFSLLFIVALSTSLGVIRSQKRNREIADNISLSMPSSFPTFPPTPASKFDKLKNIISQITDENLLNDFRSPQRNALNWITNDDSADLGSNLCFNEKEEESNDDYYLYYEGNGFRHRELVSCNDNERVLRRFVFAAFYFSTIIDTSSANDNEGDDGVYYDADFGGGRRRLMWIDDLNFLSSNHECSWHMNSTLENGDGIISQGIICKDEFDGSIILDESENRTIGSIDLHINSKSQP